MTQFNATTVIHSSNAESCRYGLSWQIVYSATMCFCVWVARWYQTDSKAWGCCAKSLHLAAVQQETVSQITSPHWLIPCLNVVWCCGVGGSVLTHTSSGGQKDKQYLTCCCVTYQLRFHSSLQSPDILVTTVTGASRHSGHGVICWSGNVACGVYFTSWPCGPGWQIFFPFLSFFFSFIFFSHAYSEEVILLDVLTISEYTVYILCTYTTFSMNLYKGDSDSSLYAN